MGKKKKHMNAHTEKFIFISTRFQKSHLHIAVAVGQTLLVIMSVYAFEYFGKNKLYNVHSDIKFEF